jgi:hypothetical protein
MTPNYQPYENYPWAKILPRWLFGASEIGLSIWAVISFNLNLGIFFAVWWAISLFVLLPLLRCTKCYYYGKRCNTGWGLIAKFAFAKNETSYFHSGYALTALLWPLRIIPFAFGILNLLDGFSFNPDGLFIIYFHTIIFHRFYYRRINCVACYQKEICPVINPQLLRNSSIAE